MMSTYATVSSEPDTVCVSAFGASGAGESDEWAAIQRALDSGAHTVLVPAGLYLLSRTLKISDRTCLHLDAQARIKLMDGSGIDADVFLLTNKDPRSGNEGITVVGGIWDGNNPGNPRGPDGPAHSYTGVAINFVNVRDLVLRNLTVRDPESFFIRLGEVRNFSIEDITLEAPHTRPNQDGVHVGGFCADGTIRRICGLGAGCPNDDMVALNANDDVTRAVNLGMKEGPIRRIQVEDITAEDAYTFIRLLSQDAPIEDVHIRRIRGGCRYHALNLNRWRFPPGKGRMTGVCIEDVQVQKRPSPNAQAVTHITLSVQDLEIRNLQRPEDGRPEVHTLEIANGAASEVEIEGLDPAQVEALLAASRDLVIRERGKQLRIELTPEGILRLPCGGLERLRIRSR